jgi:hypothetical protein
MDAVADQERHGDAKAQEAVDLWSVVEPRRQEYHDAAN